MNMNMKEFCICESPSIQIRNLGVGDKRYCNKCGKVWDEQHSLPEAPEPLDTGKPDPAPERKITTGNALKSLKDAGDSVQAALIDLARLKDLRKHLEKTDVPQQVRMFLVSIYGMPKDADPQAIHREFWRTNLDKGIQQIETYIKSVDAWVKWRKDHPHRCALPKKQQRKLGLLPPIS